MNPRLRVFVLGTGRCGTSTFAAACGHLDNFTSGHETRSALVGPERFAYPARHIEVDNRLSWYLGRLAGFDDAYFVHMRRDPEATAQSFAMRFDSAYRASIIRAFAHGIVTRARDWEPEERIAVCREYVDTVQANVDEFVRHRPSMTIDLETAAEQFPGFLSWIGATGDIPAAIAEWGVRHNASVPGSSA